LTPGPNPHGGGSHRGQLDARGIEDSFGTSMLPASGELRSRPIPLGGVSTVTGPLVIKIIGVDSKGRRVAAWADLETAGSITED
jgi:hypothetical protein